MENKLELNDFINPKENKKVVNREDQENISLIAINELLSDEKIKQNSRIKMSQVSELTKLTLYGDIFEVPFIASMVENILKYQISISGLGRKELVEIAKQPSLIPDDVVKSKDVFR